MNPSTIVEEEVKQKEGQRTRADAGRQGGTTTKKRYGSDFFRKIGKSGGKARGKQKNA